jgi:hypothetical protein
MPQVLDVIVEPRYDTNFIPTAGTQQLIFFSQPIGQGVSVFGTATTKTLADTNMDLAGQLAAGYNFQVLGFRLMPSFNMTVADGTLAFNGAVFVFSIGSKDYLRLPARSLPAGMGISTPTTTGTVWGWPDIHNGFSIAREQLVLSQTQNFAATLRWPSGQQAVTTTMATGGTTAGAAGLPVTIFLDGILQRLPQ